MSGHLKVTAGGRGGKVTIVLDGVEIQNIVESMVITGDAREGWKASLVIFTEHVDVDVLATIEAATAEPHELPA